MKIEEPEHPIDIPVVLEAERARAPEFATIGAFYLALADKIQTLGDSAFIGEPAHQVVASRWFPDPEEMFAIKDVKTAVQGITVIIDQGEGTATNPFDDSGAPAHYYPGSRRSSRAVASSQDPARHRRTCTAATRVSTSRCRTCGTWTTTPRLRSTSRAASPVTERTSSTTPTRGY